MKAEIDKLMALHEAAVEAEVMYREALRVDVCIRESAMKSSTAEAALRTALELAISEAVEAERKASAEHHLEVMRKALAITSESAAKPGEVEPVGRVAEVHLSRYTIEWTNGPLPEGTELYTAPPARVDGWQPIETKGAK